MGLTVLLTAVLSFNPRTFWEMAFEPRAGAERMTRSDSPASRRAAQLGLLGCHHCGTVWQGAAEGAPCGRCGTRLHRRKPDSIQPHLGAADRGLPSCTCRPTCCR